MPNMYDFIFFSHKNVGMISYKLYFSATKVFCTGMKTKERRFLKSPILIQRKNRKKRWCKIFGVKYIIHKYSTTV